ncbi:MAG: hypothetical protein N2595_03520 [bacterium]|nr:hypothetical protein [bacterium]
MRFGAHIYLFTPRWSDASVGLLDRFSELGLGCVELAVGDDVQFTGRRLCGARWSSCARC